MTSTIRALKIAPLLAALLLVGVGCSASTEDSCASFTTSMSNAATQTANAFAYLDSDPTETISLLEKAQHGFESSRSDWSPEVSASAQDFARILKKLTTEVEAAISDGTADPDAVMSATDAFQHSTLSLTVVCAPTTPASAEKD